ALLGAQQQAERATDAVARHHEVHALRGAYAERAHSRHRLELIRPHARGRDDLAGADLEALARLAIDRLDPHDPGALAQQTLDLHPARRMGAVLGGRAHEARDVTGVVDLGVVIDQAAAEGIRPKIGRGLRELPFGEVAVVGHAGLAAAGPGE